jgi:cell division protein ZapB
MIPWNRRRDHAGASGHAMAIDSLCSRLYIHAMAEDAHVKFEHELKRLEKRVDALVDVCDQLKDENRSLKQRQDALTAERATLLQKNEQVRARVEAMIGRLKAMEQGS